MKFTIGGYSEVANEEVITHQANEDGARHNRACSTGRVEGEIEQQGGQSDGERHHWPT